MIKKCKNPWCNKDFTPINGHQKYCSKECAAFIHERQKYEKNINDISYRNCENCGKEHNGSYGSGRFCSKLCAHSFVGKRKTTESKQKISNTLRNLSIKTRISVCEICKHEFLLAKKENGRWPSGRFCSDECRSKSYYAKQHITSKKCGGYLASCYALLIQRLECQPSKLNIRFRDPYGAPMRHLQQLKFELQIQNNVCREYGTLV